jgi:16S rRNA (cytosine1402-N4)-methyltransferase
VDDGYHIPVLLAEVLAALAPERGGVFFDGTLGGGGHAKAILAAGATRVIGVDRDPEALEQARTSLSEYGERVTLLQGNFADVAESLDVPLAGALLDLGVSSRQIDAEARGFSFRPGVLLDMRMGERGRTAADLLNSLSEKELADIFYLYGEERRSRRLAGEVVRRRRDRPFRTSDDLVAVMQRALGGHLSTQDKARIFQAMRIAVNDELEALERALPALRERLAEDGVLVVIAYHSLEDRRVKESFREWSSACICPPELPVCRCRGRALGKTLNKRVIVPSEEEIQFNQRARSARLRAWRKAA